MTKLNLILKALFFFGFGAGFIWNVYDPLFRDNVLFRDWQSAEAVVFEHDYKALTKSSRGSTTTRQVYLPLIKYRYEVNGKHYEGNRYSPYPWTVISIQELKEIYELLPIGKEIPVIYDHDSPSISYMTISFPPGFWLQITAGFLIGFSAIAFSLFNLKKFFQVSQAKLIGAR